MNRTRTASVDASHDQQSSAGHGTPLIDVDTHFAETIDAEVRIDLADLSVEQRDDSHRE